MPSVGPIQQPSSINSSKISDEKFKSAYDGSYIDSIDYQDWQDKIKDIICVAWELEGKAVAARKLRYQEIDIEMQRKIGTLAPDELYIPQHLIDMNIRRELAEYVKYVTQSNRAVVLTNQIDPSVDSSILEHDVTNRMRYDGWQIDQYACFDGAIQNGYGIFEVVYDDDKSGDLKVEYVPLGDYGIIADTKNIQDCELMCRKYYFTKTQLEEEAESGNFSKEQVLNAITNPPTGSDDTSATVDKKDRSLYPVYKIMFRVDGVVHVAWVNDDKADDWLKEPEKLYIGRRQLSGQMTQGTNVPESSEQYETDYPYIVVPYLISENNTISQLKGRAFLDQDSQEAATSLLSSYCTAHRRGSGLYFSKDTDDPNDDIALQKNVYFRTGTLINKKITQFQLMPPSAEMLGAIQTITTNSMQETSQVDFAAQNRVDSRKTATEIAASQQAASNLSTVQVVLLSTALRKMYSLMFEIITSRVLAGLLEVDPLVRPFYSQKWYVKPAGDIDVVERQQMLQQMQAMWPTMQQTPAAQQFLEDILLRQFPETAPKYIKILDGAQQQKQSQQAQQQQMMMKEMMQLAQQVVTLSKHPEFFSDAGKTTAFPQVKLVGDKLKQMMDEMTPSKSVPVTPAQQR